jgi:gliding motility-associated-like protein
MPKGSAKTVGGTYKDTLVNAQGCDSVVTVNLTVYPSSSSFHQYPQICQGDTFYLPNGVPADTSGNYITTLVNYHGCDSLITTHLKVNKKYTLNLSIIACMAHPLVLHTGQVISTAGNYYDSLKTYKGCDSVLHYHVDTLVSKYQSGFYVCPGNPIVLPCGTVVTMPGLYTCKYTSIQSCDSNVIYNVLSGDFTSFSTFIVCPNKPYTFPNGQTTTHAGTYPDTILLSSGCHHYQTIILDTLYRYTVYKKVCPGFTDTLPNGQVVAMPGSYAFTAINNSGGCDTIYTFAYLYHSKDTTLHSTVCPNNPFLFPDSSGSTILPGTYFNQLISYEGCDSNMTIMLTTGHISVNVYDTICSSQTFHLPWGPVVSASGVYSDSGYTYKGCDSFTHLYLQILPSTSKFIVAELCNKNAYTLPNGNVITQSYTYRDTLINTFLCDSFLTVQVLFFPTYADTTVHLICRGDTVWLPKGYTINSGIFIDTFAAFPKGCDSILIHEVTVYEPVEVLFPKDTALCLNHELILAATAQSTATYLWNTGATLNFIQPSTSGLYTLAVSNWACPPLLDSIQVKIQDCSCVLQMPNAFTPNNDKENDFLLPRKPCAFVMNNYLFKIYTRWGEMIFETHEFTQCWNGEYKNTPQELGTYLFTVSYFNDEIKKQEFIKGDFELIR